MEAFKAEIARQKGGGGGGAGGDLAALMGGGAKKKGGVDLKKYERMKKMGLPMNSILNKMRMDGCTEKDIEKFGGKAAKKAEPAEDERQVMPADVKPTKRMKPFHWAKIVEHQSQTTIWKELDAEIPSLCAAIDFKEIEALFNRAAEAEAKKTQKAKEAKRENQLIDPKRAQNVMIGLSQVKMSDDDLLDAILKMDDKKLTVDKLRKLLPYVPSDGELQMVRDYVKNGGNVNELSKVEQFFVKMMDMVGIRQRVSLWIFKSEFPSILQNVQRRLGGVSDAIKLLMDNAKLKKVLYIILCIGNYLNAGSSRGNAFGFLMEPTLDLLDGTKSFDKKTSLMLEVVETIDRVDSSCLEWVDECEILERVYKIKTNGLLTDLDAIKRDMGAIEKYLKAQRRTMTKMASDWAREGTAVSINQLAGHIRRLSKAGPAALAQGCETYAGLKVGLGGYGKVSVGMSAEEGKDDDEDETENVFGKVMMLFHKKQKSKVTEVETFLKKTQQETKKLGTYYGFEEGKKWEEILIVFYSFREKFMKALREQQIKKAKEQRKLNQNEKKNQLAAKLALQPKKEDVVKTLNLDMDLDADSNEEQKSTKSGSGKGKASAMYAAFKKSKKGSSA
eukprot:276634_1